MIRQQNEQGFSTIELILSLFIAAAFIGTGFQLFSVVMKDSDEARLRATAGALVNTTLQEKMNSTNSPCSPVPTTINFSIATAQLPQAAGVVTYTCPYGTSSKTTRISVVITYSLPQETVEGSLDVTK